MKKPETPGRTGTCHQHLKANARKCAKRNIAVQVDKVNSEHTVAFCSVGQRSTGLLVRTYTYAQLVWRAEQALAPLLTMGLLPLINVHMPTDPGARSGRHPADAPRNWLQRIMDHLRDPFAREGFSPPVRVGDPFGYLAAVRITAHR